MDLKTYVSNLSKVDRATFADRCGASIGHMLNVVYGVRTASTELAVAIERESNGAVTRIEMFPETYGNKWPELMRG
jgi:hypothetical protein